MATPNYCSQLHLPKQSFFESLHLPKQSFFESLHLCKFQGFWFFQDDIDSIMSSRSQFIAREDDIFLASSMKTGTTWLKALCACIVGNKASTYCHSQEDDKEDPLLKDIVHVHMPNLENLYRVNPQIDLSKIIAPPRLFHTHMPYKILPDSIKNTNCKIIYVVRNPKDTLVSLWHFFQQLVRKNQEQETYPIEKAFESFRNGVHPYGPFFDHALEYWNESLKSPERVLFLKYEELKRDPRAEVKKLGLFLGRPLEEDEVDRVIKRSSLERMKNSEAHTRKRVNWVQDLTVRCDLFFRKGVVGDWKNHFTPEMAEILDEMAETALEGSGLRLLDLETSME